jgi:hypothetical protein
VGYRGCLCFSRFLFQGLDLNNLVPIEQETDLEIPYYESATEFEVQAELYTILKQLGLDVRGEVCYKTKDMQCRFDLVIFRGKKPKRIVEVKAKKIKHKTCLEDTRQARRYRKFGLIVSFVYGREDFPSLITSLINTGDLYEGASIKAI